MKTKQIVVQGMEDTKRHLCWATFAESAYRRKFSALATLCTSNLSPIRPEMKRASSWNGTVQLRVTQSLRIVKVRYINKVRDALGCGGTLSGSSGEIISPNYPQPSTYDAACTWKVVVSSGSTIDVVFGDLDLTSTSNCAQEYVQISDGLRRKVQRFCYEKQR